MITTYYVITYTRRAWQIVYKKLKMDYQNRFRETLNRKAEFGSSDAPEDKDNVRLSHYTCFVYDLQP